MLRFMSGNGTGGIPHVATVDVPLSDGVVVPAGEVVVPIPDSANRDPAVFSEPDCLRTDRGDNPHVTFGYGPHYCLGAELARLEMQVGISALVSALPELRIAVADEKRHWRTDMFVCGL
jgi:nocardicin N-oxygenase